MTAQALVGPRGASWGHQVATQVGAAAVNGVVCTVVNVALLGLRIKEAEQVCPGQHILSCSGDVVTLALGRQVSAGLSQAVGCGDWEELRGSGRGCAWPVRTYPAEQSRL